MQGTGDQPTLTAMRRLPFLLTVLLMLMSLTLSAAPLKKITKRYKDTRLEAVLADVCKTTGLKLDVSGADGIDMNKRITAEFKQATPNAVMKKVLDKEYQAKIRKGSLVITKRPAPPVTFTVEASEPASIRETDTTTVQTYQDTLFSVTCHTVTREVSKEEAERLGAVSQQAQNNKNAKAKGKKAPAKKKAAAKKKGKSAKKTAKKSTKKSTTTGKTVKVAPEPAPEPVAEKPQAPAGERKGHWLQASLGGAYADLGYDLKDPASGLAAGAVHGSFGGNLRLQYAYYWNDHWGIGAGVGMSTYAAYGTLNTAKTFAGQTDSDGELYDHRAVTHDWRERQAMYNVDIPVNIQMQYPVGDKLRLYAMAGVQVGIPVAGDRALRSGSVEHQGDYSRWGLNMEQLPNHDFYTEHIGTDFSTAPTAVSYSLPAVAVGADLGVSIPVAPRLDLMVGAYMHYTCNSMQDKADATDMGWRRNDYSGADAWKNHDFMNTYAGMHASEYVQALHPWQVGIRIGIAWQAPQPKRKVKPEPEQHYYARIQECDTTYTLQPRVVTVRKPRQAVQEIVRLMEKSVIWFDLNSSVPKLEPADILDRIADVLIKNPQQRISINGHASKEGSQKRNQKLSEDRARAIERLLLQKGVRPQQMQVNALSSSQAYQQGEHAISLDRRVEIIPIEE